MSDRSHNRNDRVSHIYDSSCKGTLVRANRDEVLVGVIWDDRPGVVHPCIREEVVFPPEPRSERRPRRDDRDNRRRRDYDDE